MFLLFLYIINLLFYLIILINFLLVIVDISCFDLVFEKIGCFKDNYIVLVRLLLEYFSND